MARFNIEVELEWVDEDGNIDSEIQVRVIKDLAKAISEKVNGDKASQIAEKVSDAVDALVNKEFESLLSQEVVLRDNYGDVKTKYDSVREMIKARFDNYISQPVDSNDGTAWNNNGYGRGQKITRFEYIMGKAFGSELEKKMKDLKATVEKDTEVAMQAMFAKMKETLEKSIKGHLGEKVADLIKLDEVLKLKSGK